MTSRHASSDALVRTADRRYEGVGGVQKYPNGVENSDILLSGEQYGESRSVMVAGGLGSPRGRRLTGVVP